MEEERKIIKLTGRPKKRTKKEKGIWSLFTDFIKDKWKLGNEYLSARVLKEKAEAFEKITQSLKTIQEAKEIAQRIDTKDIKYLSATKGTTINIEVEEEEEVEEKINPKDSAGFLSDNID